MRTRIISCPTFYGHLISCESSSTPCYPFFCTCSHQVSPTILDVVLSPETYFLGASPSWKQALKQCKQSSNASVRNSSNASKQASNNASTQATNHAHTGKHASKHASKHMAIVYGDSNASNASTQRLGPSATERVRERENAKYIRREREREKQNTPDCCGIAVHRRFWN